MVTVIEIIVLVMLTHKALITTATDIILIFDFSERKKV